jgi:hypothetical protein
MAAVHGFDEGKRKLGSFGALPPKRTSIKVWQGVPMSSLELNINLARSSGAAAPIRSQKAVLVLGTKLQ